MTDILGVGIIGCGNISTAYLRLAPLFRGLKVRVVADIDMDAATSQAEAFGVEAQSVEDLLGNPKIDVIVNLTIPASHSAVSLAALAAGKHVYSEKPLALSVEDGLMLRAKAQEKGLYVGCAPDTFLGGSHQLARRLVDEGKIGRITSGTAYVMSHGMEHWHPNPDFFFQPGAGPMLDVGPYYVANLINLVGPVRRVAALANSATPTRTVLSEPRRGEEIPVQTPSNIHALLEFQNGASVTLSTSWDVWAHRHGNMDLYGTEGAMFVPDPNYFGGKLEMAGRDGAIAPVKLWDHPFGVLNDFRPGRSNANYRTAGLADMALAIIEGRDARCSLERTLHGLDVMTSVLKSGETGTFVEIGTTCTRPDPLGPDDARALLADPDSHPKTVAATPAPPAGYETMSYRRCGRSGLDLPAISLGLWQNFGGYDAHDNKRAILRKAFDLGITHFDLANNYGPPPGSAEEAFGEILKTDFAGRRDELIISSKAGYRMWDGPYGEMGSRKYLIASCDQSLKRMGLDYVDIFYSHRFDPDTPLEETMQALDTIVRSGRALYVGLSSYNSQRTREAVAILKDLGTPCLIHQPSYSMLNRWIEEDGLLDTLDDLGIGSIVFSPLAQGVLTGKYLGGVPQGSRAAKGAPSFRPAHLEPETLERVRGLAGVAERRGQSLAQMALAWVLRGGRVTTALIGASRPEQVEQCVGALDNLDFTAEELAEIDRYATDSGINLWARSSETEKPQA